MSKVLFVGHVWPEPTSSAAGWRILHLIRLMLQQYEVHFASAASKSAYSYNLQSLGVIEHTILLNDFSFDILLKDLCPVAVVFDRFMIEEQYSWRVVEQVPNAIRILDTEDLHFLRKARRESYTNGTEIDYNIEITKREIASIIRSDVSLIISKFEQNLLLEKFKIAKERLFYMPFQEELLDDKPLRKTFAERSNFVFIGNFIHEPNWHTVQILKYKVWPLLRKRVPKAEIHIYGAYASDKVNQLNKPIERFLIRGRAIDARETLENYRLLLAPIPFGAGVKGKFVDCMYAGTPSITTSTGAEDILLFEGRWAGYIVDNLDDLVDKAVNLYTKEEVWNKYHSIGYKIFNKSFSDQSFSYRFLQWVDAAIKNTNALRSNNFLGQLLLQQQFNATKYLSLWIEEKNKKVNKI